MSNHPTSKKSPWGLKAAIIAFILSVLFLGFFYLAMSNEPDYMPSQKKQAQGSHQMGASEPTATEMNMTEQEHAHMAETEASSAHNSH